MSQSQKMRNALSKYVISNLTAKGFVGKYPHYKRIYDDRIELLVFETNKWGNSFTVEISTVFLCGRKRDNNFCCGDFETIENATVWDTNLRYRLKGMYDGWFYYTDLYIQKTNSMTFYNAVSEDKAKNYIPAKNEVLVQKADDEIYRKVCEEVNDQMPKAFKWWDAFNKNDRIKMRLLQIFN
ncbi:MAG: DUF4304 domain-containing protein [Eubacteriales bacterium]